MYKDYLMLTYPGTGGLTGVDNILYCPSGVRRKRVDYPSQGDPPMWELDRYQCRNNIDYAMPGASLKQGDATYMFWDFAKADRLWSYEHRVGGETYVPLFSFEEGFVQFRHQDGGEGWYPHSSDDGSALETAGMNIIETDGSGRWVPKAACSLTYYGVGGGYWRLYPIGYYILTYPSFASPSYPNGSPTGSYFKDAASINNLGYLPPGDLGYSFSAP